MTKTCKAARCSNAARYSSGYCGIHDIEFNEGKGERIKWQTICAHCNDIITDGNYWQAVRGIGDLCQPCHKEHFSR